MNKESTVGASEQVRLQNEIDQIEQKRAHLITAIEEGGNISSLVERLRELEKEKERISTQIQELKENAEKQIDPEEIVKAVNSFYGQFETDIREAPQYLKKELMRMVVKEIGIDPEERVVHCFLRTLPTTNDKIPTEKPGFRIDPVAGVGLEPTTFGL
jgi:chromosome condensin MukBEF ATPase and DNA-binding subunit MukB